MELGIALNAKGTGRILLVMNTAFGPPDELPFDLRHHSFPIQYTLPNGSSKEAVKAERAKLADRLTKAFRLILRDVATKDAAEKGRLEAASLAARREEARSRREAFEEQVRRNGFYRFRGSAGVMALSIIPLEPVAMPIDLAQFETNRRLPLVPFGGVPTSGVGTHAETSAIRLNAPMPFIKLRAAATKGRRADSLPLRGDMVAELQSTRGDAGDGDKLFAAVPTIEEHREYLTAAGIEWKDAEGRRADINALRHTYGTLLSKSGASPREAMELMRHTDMRLTMKVYTDPRLFNLSSAVEKLPLPPLPDGPKQHQSQLATGTDVNAHHLEVAPVGGANEAAKFTADSRSTPLTDMGLKSETPLQPPVFKRHRPASSAIVADEQGEGKTRQVGLEATAVTLGKHCTCTQTAICGKVYVCCVAVMFVQN